MSGTTRPLDEHQQKLVAIVKAAHQNLAIARKTKAQEYQRRTSLMRAELEMELLRKIDEGNERIRLELDAEVTAHEGSLDDSLIAAYNAGIPVLRIAREGFGNRYPGGVQQLLVKLRNDGLIGSTVGQQRNTNDGITPTIAFPKAIDVEATINEANTISAPVFTLLPDRLELVPGDPTFSVAAVQVNMDPRDPWFKHIEANARPGTPYKRATDCTIYLHPATGDLTVYESKEEGETLWDHPVARWVYTHLEEVMSSYRVATLSVPGPPLNREDVEKIAKLADQLGTNVDDA
jgi:hypothetical protein